MHVGGLMGIESTRVTPPYSLPSGGWVPQCLPGYLIKADTRNISYFNPYPYGQGHEISRRDTGETDDGWNNPKTR